MSRYYSISWRSSDWLFKNVDQSKTILELKPSELFTNKSSNLDLLKLSDYQSVGSYNWSNESRPGRPVAIIPGQADTLKPTLPLIQLRKSQHEQMVDENRHYDPEYPLEVLIRAVQICSPEFSFKRVDFVTDRNNLRKLLNFVESKADESFRIDFQRVGNMVALIRKEEKSSMACNDNSKDFDKNSIDLGLEQGVYKRIVSYKFGEFNMVVRFQVDCVEKTASSVKSLNQSRTGSNAESVDYLTEITRKASLNLGPVKNFEDPSSTLSYILHGRLNKNEKLVELTTKSAFETYEFPERKWNQLFFSRTDLLVIGWHSRGKLQRIEKLSFDQVTQRSKRNTPDTRDSLDKLHDLLSRIKKLALSSGDETNSPVYSIIFDPSDSPKRLKVFKSSEKFGALPIQLISSLSK